MTPGTPLPPVAAPPLAPPPAPLVPPFPPRPPLATKIPHVVSPPVAPGWELPSAAPPAPPVPTDPVIVPPQVAAIDCMTQYSPAPPPPAPCAAVEATVAPPPPAPVMVTHTDVTPVGTLNVNAPVAVYSCPFRLPPPAEDAMVIVLPAPPSVIVIFDPAVRTRELASVASVAWVMNVCERFSDAGRSAATRARNVGCAGAPVVGPAHTVLADSVALVTARVPAVVTGEPLTLNSAGIDRPTLVTEPVPTPPGRSAKTSALNVSHTAASGMRSSA